MPPPATILASASISSKIEAVRGRRGPAWIARLAAIVAARTAGTTTSCSPPARHSAGRHSNTAIPSGSLEASSAGATPSSPATRAAAIAAPTGT